MDGASLALAGLAVGVAAGPPPGLAGRRAWRILAEMAAHPAASLAAASLALLHGTVTIGPLTPVCRVGVPCDKPAASVVLTFSRGARAFRTRTHADGTYTLPLPAGSYLVSSSAGMRISPVHVTVRSGSHAQPFSIDTGIR